MVLRSRSSLAFSTRYPSREQLHQSRPRPIRAPCCCPTCVVGAFIGPPAPTPRPAIKHGTHVVKRNRNRYCYRSHGRYGTLEQFARRRDTIHLVPYALFRGPIFHAARPRGACNADRFSSDRSRNRMVPRARMKCYTWRRCYRGEKKKESAITSNGFLI